MAYLDNLLTRNERVLLTARRHPIYVVRRTAVLLIGGLILWMLALIAFFLLPGVGGIPIDLILGLILFAMSLVPLAIAGYRFLFWWHERYIITNYRILQVEGLLNRRTFDSALEMVNGVEMDQGVLGRIFNYATIHILTGSDVGVNDIEGVAKAFEFKRALLEAKLAFSGGDITMDIDDSRPAGRGFASRSHDQDTARFPPVGDSSADPARMIVALTELRNAGVISQSEYDEKLRTLTRGESPARPWDSG